MNIDLSNLDPALEGAEAKFMDQVITMFHVSKVEHLDSIMKHGLTRDYLNQTYNRGFYRTMMPGIYLSDDDKFLLHEISSHFPSSKLLLHIKIKLGQLLLDEDQLVHRYRNWLAVEGFEVPGKQITRDFMRSKTNFEMAKTILINPNYKDIYIKFAKVFRMSEEHAIKTLHHTGGAILKMFFMKETEAKVLIRNRWDLQDYRKVFTQNVMDSYWLVLKALTRKKHDDWYSNFYSFVTLSDIGFVGLPKISEIQEYDKEVKHVGTRYVDNNPDEFKK